MPYAFTLDVPGNEDIYNQINAKIRAHVGNTSPDGLISHVVYKTETGLRHVEVWETKEAWDAFDAVLGPMIGEVLAGNGIPSDGGAGTVTNIEVIDTWVRRVTSPSWRPISKARSPSSPAPAVAWAPPPPWRWPSRVARSCVAARSTEAAPKRTPGTIDAVVAHIRPGRRRRSPCPTNLADEEDIVAMVARDRRRFRPPRRVGQQRCDHVRRRLGDAHRLRPHHGRQRPAPFIAIREAVPHLRAAGGGSIVNVSSAAALMPSRHVGLRRVEVGPRAR